MKWIKWMCAFLLLFGLISNNAAWAQHRHFHHHRHGHVGVFIAAPLPWIYPPQSYYAYPPVVAVPSSPPIYIERSDAPQSQSQGSDYWWYYCPNQRAYYPYIKECPTGWQRVPARPSDLAQ